MNLDSAVSIPALLVNSTNEEMEGLALKMGNHGTPGKFYGPDAASTLLNTVRANGVSAQLVIDDNANSDEKNHFKHFTDRLKSGDLVSSYHCFKSWTY